MQVVAVGGDTQGGDAYGGAMGITPIASPAVPGTPRDGPPSGSTPSAKRPREREEQATSGGLHTIMSLQELTDGFHELGAKCAVDATHLGTTATAVAWNADLLNALILRVDKVEMHAGVVRAKVDQMDLGCSEMATKVHEIIARLDLIVPQVKTCFDYVANNDAILDGKLRDELDIVIAKIDSEYGKLDQRIGVVERRPHAQAESSSASSGSGSDPTLRDLQRQLDIVSGTARQACDQLNEFSKCVGSSDSKISGLETTVGQLVPAVSDLSSKVAVLQ